MAQRNKDSKNISDIKRKESADEAELNTISEEVDKQKLPLVVKLFGLLCLAGGVIICATLALLVVTTVLVIHQGTLSDQLSTTSLVIFCVETALMTILAAMFAILGIRLLRNKRRNAARLTDAMIVLIILIILCDMMLSGLAPSLIPYGVVLVLLIALQSYVDPSLAEERELQRKLRDMETREAAEDGTLGRDESGKGYIALNFFNLFWIFVVCCILGLIIETLYHFVVVDPGHYQNRAGLLFGPFSPIYGFGAVLMTVALNRFHNKNVIIIFLVSAIIGGAFEYLTSWFMQFAFGIVAWDYSGTFLSIDGRTNGMFMAMWGLLGVVWIKLLLPWMLRLVNLIPWNWRYTLTSICAVLMIADGAMTLLALDCWYQREAGAQQETAIAEFMNKHFDNAFMEERFQSMSIDPNNATRSTPPSPPS